MNLPLLIAQKTTQTTTSTQSTMVRLATVAVAVSIAVMAITVAVVAGFGEKIGATLRDISADIVVTDLSSLYGAEANPISKSDNLNTIFSSAQGIESIDEYALRGCVVRSEKAASGIILKGVATIPENSVITECLTLGTLPEIGDTRNRDILLPKSVATRLGVGIGERVEIITTEGKSSIRPTIFKVSGIYSPPIDNTSNIAFTDIRNVQRINGWDYSTVSGFEIRVSEPKHASYTTDIINDLLFNQYQGTENIAAISSRDLYATIFAWIDTHDINAVVIIVIMFIVALFNMITAMLIMVFERTRMVGILKSLGMNNNSIRQIFANMAAKIVIKGVTIGNIAAIILIVIQKFTGAIKLDKSAYFVSEVPVSIGVIEFLTINIIFAVAILALTFAATSIVARIKPSEAVKFE